MSSERMQPIQLHWDRSHILWIMMTCKPSNKEPFLYLFGQQTGHTHRRSFLLWFRKSAETQKGHVRICWPHLILTRRHGASSGTWRHDDNTSVTRLLGRIAPGHHLCSSRSDLRSYSSFTAKTSLLFSTSFHSLAVAVKRPWFMVHLNYF